MIEVAVIVVAVVLVIVALVHDRDDVVPPAHLESGGTHLRGDRKPRPR